MSLFSIALPVNSRFGVDDAGYIVICRALSCEKTLKTTLIIGVESLLRELFH